MVYCIIEEHRLTVFPNKVLRRIFDSGRDEYGKCQMLYSEELNRLYRMSNYLRVVKSIKIEVDREFNMNGENMNYFKISTGKSTGSRPIGRLSVDRISHPSLCRYLKSSSKCRF